MHFGHINIYWQISDNIYTKYDFTFVIIYMVKYNLLIPGRHHLMTNFQFDYLSQIIRQKNKITDILWRDVEKIWVNGEIGKLIFAITSSNHKNTKRNPISGAKRETLINDFAKWLNLESLIYHIDDIWLSDKFCAYLSKKIAVESNRNVEITPENTIVMTSTPDVARWFVELGYKVISAEYDVKLSKYIETTPRPIMQKIIEKMKLGIDPNSDAEIIKLMHSTTIDIYNKYNIREQIYIIDQDKILLEDGDITKTRDYNTYARSFDEGAERKFDYISSDIKAWNIVDIWCCTGGLLAEVSKDSKFAESDLYGIDIVPKFIEICEQGKALWKFKNENSFFLTKNIIDNLVFKSNFIDTAISFALTHEVISYDSYDKLKTFMTNLYDQINLGWRWINFDVIWPSNPDEQIIATLAKLDGYDFVPIHFKDIYNKVSQDYDTYKQERKTYISWLNTYGRFLLFAKTFRAKQWDWKCDYTELWHNKIQIKNQDLCEFLSKKDYTDNWLSEMNEYFCFMNQEKRYKLAEEVGFKVNPSSELIYNDWIYENRYKWKVTMTNMEGNEIKNPPTNIKLVFDK